MIRYLPKCRYLSLSLRSEVTFETMEELIHFVYTNWSRVVSFMGAAEPFRKEEIIIGENLGDDARIGYKNVRQILVRRMKDNIYSAPMCIGYCGE
jgi:hypothetical protein